MRTRKNQLKIYLSDEEKELFNQKKIKSGIKNMTNFIKKTVLEKDIFVIDFDIFYKLKNQLEKQGNNINQIAKNQNSIIKTTGKYKDLDYKNDIEEIKNTLKEFQKEIRKISDFFDFENEN